MSLTTHEIRIRAERFVAEWANPGNESSDAQTFWADLFGVFGVARRRVATFEHPVGRGRADLFWPGVLLAENKTPGRSLVQAMEQAVAYTRDLADDVFPRWIVVTDMTRFVVRDLELDTPVEFAVAQLPDRLQLLEFIRGRRPDATVEESVTKRASADLATLYKDLVSRGYPADAAELVIVRLGWLMFAEDIGLIDRHLFRDLIISTRDDGTDLGMVLANLFAWIATPTGQRMTGDAGPLTPFQHVPGWLFADTVPAPILSAEFRSAVIRSSRLDWARVDPAIFGSLFENVLSADARRQTGSHYTSETDVLRVIGPTFLDGLRQELLEAGQSVTALTRFQKRLGRIRVLDPACGTANFLTITLRELLRLDIAAALISGSRAPAVSPVCVSGIEIQEFAARLARLCIEITWHQMMLEASGTGLDWDAGFDGEPIRCADALAIAWEDIVPVADLDAIVGNPPYLGSRGWSPEQRAGLHALYKPLGVKSTGSLDLCAAWVVKAAAMMAGNPGLSVGMVTTNSLTQGQQVAPLWDSIRAHCPDARLAWARTSFVWSGAAAVHCVLLGLDRRDGPARLWRGDGEDAELHDLIGPYLVPGTDVIVRKRSKPWRADTPRMTKGSYSLDGNNLILSRAERDALLEKHPEAADLVRPFVGGRELLYPDERWCLWLADVEPTRWSGIPEIRQRVAAVREMRMASSRKATRGAATTPWAFAERRFRLGTIIVFPQVTGGTREYVPLDRYSDVVVNAKGYAVPYSALTFGVLHSKIHMAWMRSSSGRLSTSFSYSPQMTYNTFPFPGPDPDQSILIESAAQAVLDARAAHPDSCLAELYDPLAMPTDLRAAHSRLDRVVESAYRVEPFRDDAERLAHLLELYQELAGK